MSWWVSELVELVVCSRICPSELAKKLNCNGLLSEI